MTDEVTRYNLRSCPDCNGNGTTLYVTEAGKPGIYNPDCPTCEGRGYVPAAPAPEDKPAAGLLYAALKEAERLQAQLREQSAINADLFRQMEAEAARADEAEARYQRVAGGLADEIAALKADNARLRDGIGLIASEAQHKAFNEEMPEASYARRAVLGIRDMARALLENTKD